MQLLFLHGGAASGKLTVARELADLTGMALFHNHLVVDAVAAVFPFGSPAFVALRERFWLEIIGEAARQGRSLIFTFAPEPSVAAGFPERVAGLVASHGGTTTFVALRVDPAEQERRIGAASRAAFGKLRSVELLRQLKADFDACERMMPPPDLEIDTTSLSPGEAAGAIQAIMRAA